MVNPSNLVAALKGSQQKSSNKPEPAAVGPITERLSFRLFTNGKESRIGFGNSNKRDEKNPGWTTTLDSLPELFDAVATAIEAFCDDTTRLMAAHQAQAAYERLSDKVTSNVIPNGSDSMAVQDLRS